MTPELHSMLLTWLESGTDDQKRHAEYRLAQSDAEPLEYPSIFQQATNLAHSVGSVVASAVRGEQIIRSKEEQARFIAICEACDKFDQAQRRCTLCGCYGSLKNRLATEHCPDDPPRW